MDLFEQVFHAIEGEERTPSVWHTADGEQTLVRRTFGPDRWIERAHSGRLDAVNLLAVILFVVRDFDGIEAERRIVESWAEELRAAAESGEIKARNSITLLPVHPVPDGWDWLVSLDDADAFVKARGMEWSCTSIVGHLLDETRKAGERWYDEAGRLAYTQWRRGYEPGHGQLDAAGTGGPSEASSTEVGGFAANGKRRQRASADTASAVVGLLAALFVERAGAGKYLKDDGNPNAKAIAEEIYSAIESRASDDERRIIAAGLSIDNMRRTIADGVGEISSRIPGGGKLLPLRSLETE